MKKLKISTIAAIAVYAMLAVGVSSCNNVNSEKTKNEKEEPIKDGDFEYDGGFWSSMDYRIEERTIDSCQYIIIFGAEGRNIIHKANCRNAVHTCR